MSKVAVNQVMSN